MEGLFITLEGVEGSGKSTQIEVLAKYLIQKNYSVLKTREPGGTEIGDRIREILLDTNLDNLSDKTELLLYFASRAQHVVEVIKPSLQKNKVVLCDRFGDSTLAYQGYARGIGLELIKELEQLTIGDLKPDLTFLLDIDPEVGLARARNLTKAKFGDRIESETIEFHQRVRAGYLNLAKNNNRFEIINANLAKEKVSAELLKRLKVRLEDYEDSK
ncbi:dTMP kinase [Fuchsiella alkaliacetigena]|uniref:dTMP kinase n=1 Tax=Fuchsiella alkaliacetigena TaxID=957042 RepID=UPI00200A1D69|nr:dTMP kinase [Fuchsiella alkaliacetigena]MCK8824502.1 dTMP kinase [Fuchsiella alkaliacetigena]